MASAQDDQGREVPEGIARPASGSTHSASADRVAKGHRAAWGCLWPAAALALGVVVGGLALWAGLALWLGGGMWQKLQGAAQPTVQFTFAGPTVNQVQSLSLLTVQSVQVVSEVQAEASYRKGVWIVRGSADYVVDFSKAQLVRRDDAGKALTIRLPSPTVRNARLDEERTRLVTYERTGLGWWTIGMAGSFDEFKGTSRERMGLAVQQAAREAQFMTLAKLSAERLVTSIYELTGWRVAVEWE